MRVWLVHSGEPIPGIDAGAPRHRYGMLAEALVARGHEVVWWTSTFEHRTKRYRCASSTTVAVAAGVTLRLLHARPAYRRNVSVARWLHHRALARAFASAAGDAAPPDAIVGCLPIPELCDAAVAYGERACVPVVVDIEDPWPDVYLSAVPPFARGVAKTALRGEYRRLSRIIGGAAAVTAVSDTFLRWGLAHGDDGRPPGRVFPLGFGGETASSSAEVRARVDRVRERYALPQAAALVVFNGTFKYYDDLDVILDCARLLQREGRADVHFVLAGDGDRMPDVRRRCAGLPNVTFTGWLDPPSLADLLRTAAVGLCAYRRHAAQTLPYKCFEYMAAGLPQVASLGGEFADLLRAETIGCPYEAGSAASLRAALVSLIDAPRLRDAMARNARTLYDRRFTAARVYPGMAAFIESCAATWTSEWAARSGPVALAV